MTSRASSALRKPTKSAPPSKTAKAKKAAAKPTSGKPTSNKPASKSKPAVKAGRGAAAKSSAKPAKKVVAAKTGIGTLPEWNLGDLYMGIDAPEIAQDRKSVV